MMARATMSIPTGVGSPAGGAARLTTCKAPMGLGEEQGSMPCASARWPGTGISPVPGRRIDPAGSRAFTTPFAPSRGWQLLREVVSFYKADAGRVVLATHDRGVVTSRKRLHERR